MMKHLWVDSNSSACFPALGLVLVAVQLLYTPQRQPVSGTAGSPREHFIRREKQKPATDLSAAGSVLISLEPLLLHWAPLVWQFWHG